MGEIRFISTATVAQRRKPNESTQRIDLNPWELRYLLFVPIQKGVLLRKPTQDQQMTNIIHHLKTSLERTLDLFYPLAGRLGTTVNGDDDTTCFLSTVMAPEFRSSTHPPTASPLGTSLTLSTFLGSCIPFSHLMKLGTTTAFRSRCWRCR